MSLGGVVTEYELKFNFKISNNMTKYQALIANLTITKELGVQGLKVSTDS